MYWDDIDLRMTFNNSYKQVMECSSASHVWIRLHRLVEAYGRTVGSPFLVVFAELERRFAFRRNDRDRWPDLDTMRRAAQWLRGERDRALADRRVLISTRRIAKEKGQRDGGPPELRGAEERTRANAESIPRVGYWGWRKKRELEA